MSKNSQNGRKSHVRCPVDEVIALDKTGIRRAEIAERLEISKSSVDRIIIRERRKAGLVPLFVAPRAGRGRAFGKL